MKHEMMRQPAPPAGENVGDVLASIRRLIAQDEAGSYIPNLVLNTLGGNAGRNAAPQQDKTAVTTGVVPLVLNRDDQIPAEQSGQSDSAPVPDTADPEDISPWQRAISEVDFNKLWADAPDGLSDPLQADQPDKASRKPDFLRASFDETDHSTKQTEDNMLQANASVTPINPHIDPLLQQPEDDVLRDTAEPHLFTPKDKDAQKGMHLRGMIREAIRQELQGEIGNRLSRNLQQMIRHEIELTLRQMCEQD